MKNIVIHHSADFDGIFCREIARKFLPDSNFIGWDFGQPLICLDGVEGNVYILDLSPDCIYRSSNIAAEYAPNNVIWIDHHKSSIEKFPVDIPGYRIDGVAACRLAWQWFQNYAEWNGGQEGPRFPTKQEYVERTVHEPLAVRLAGEYDIWDKRDPNAELFQHGLRSEELYSTAWNDMLDVDGQSTVIRLLNQGRALQYAQSTQNESIIKSIGFDVEWEGLKFLACNHARYNSFLFTAGLKPEHDACLGFKWTGTKWSVSLYHAPGKEHHDLSSIAVKHGGGGHRGACGFTSDTLPFIP